MMKALAGGGAGEKKKKGGSSVWVVNDLACEGTNHACTTKAKAQAVPVSEPGDRVIFGRPGSEEGAPFDVMGGVVGVGDKVFIVAIGDGGCCTEVLRVYKDKAAAEEGMERITELAGESGMGAWVEELTIE